MPIIDTNVIDGPNVQASGQHRGTLEFIFSDGRKVTRNVRAADATAWANLILDLPAGVQESMEQNDAQEGIGPDVEIIANKEANIKQRAVAYLRAAMEEERAFDAFLLLDKFNDFRLAKGWNLNQVVAGLASAGMTEEEWAGIKAAYQYLSSAGRPAIMDSAKTIQAQWEAR